MIRNGKGYKTHKINTNTTRQHKFFGRRNKFFSPIESKWTRSMIYLKMTKQTEKDFFFQTYTHIVNYFATRNHHFISRIFLLFQFKKRMINNEAPLTFEIINKNLAKNEDELLFCNL